MGIGVRPIRIARIDNPLQDNVIFYNVYKDSLGSDNKERGLEIRQHKKQVNYRKTSASHLLSTQILSTSHSEHL